MCFSGRSSRYALGPLLSADVRLLTMRVWLGAVELLLLTGCNAYDEAESENDT